MIGLNDGEEIVRKTDPLLADTDGDVLLDGDEVKEYKTRIRLNQTVMMII